MPGFHLTCTQIQSGDLFNWMGKHFLRVLIQSVQEVPVWFQSAEDRLMVLPSKNCWTGCGCCQKRIRIINTKSITPGKKHSSGLHLVLILMQSYSILSHQYSHSRPVSTLSGKSTSHVDCCSDADVHLLTVSISECQNVNSNKHLKTACLYITNWK